jgi:hypothetical protein
MGRSERRKPDWDALISTLERDHGLSVSWDGLRGFWNVELNEEGIRLRDEHDEYVRKMTLYTL